MPEVRVKIVLCIGDDQNTWVTFSGPVGDFYTAGVRQLNLSAVAGEAFGYALESWLRDREEIEKRASGNR